MAKYTVKKGESYASIAGDVYGNQRWFQALASANGGRALTPGMVINIPDFDTQQTPVVTEQFMQAAAQQQQVYDTANQNVAFPESPYNLGLITPALANQGPVAPEIVPQGQTVGDQNVAGYRPNLNPYVRAPGAGEYTGGAGRAVVPESDIYAEAQNLLRKGIGIDNLEPTISARNVQQVRSQIKNDQVRATLLNYNVQQVQSVGQQLGLSPEEAGQAFRDVAAGPLSGLGAFVAGVYSLATRPLTVAAANRKFVEQHGRQPTLDERFQIWAEVAAQQGQSIERGTQRVQDAVAGPPENYNQVLGTVQAGNNRQTLPDASGGGLAPLTAEETQRFFATAILGETYQQRYGEDASAQVLSDIFLAGQGLGDDTLFQNQGRGAPSAGLPTVSLTSLAPSNILLSFGSPENPKEKGTEINPAMERIQELTVQKTRDQLAQTGYQLAVQELVAQGVPQAMAEQAASQYSADELVQASGGAVFLQTLIDATTEEFFGYLGYGPRDDNPNIWHPVTAPLAPSGGTAGSILGGGGGGNTYSLPGINIGRYLTGGGGGGGGGSGSGRNSMASNYGSGSAGLYLWRISA